MIMTEKANNLLKHEFGIGYDIDSGHVDVYRAIPNSKTKP